MEVWRAASRMPKYWEATAIRWEDARRRKGSRETDRTVSIFPSWPNPLLACAPGRFGILPMAATSPTHETTNRNLHNSQPILPHPTDFSKKKGGFCILREAF